MEGFTNSNPTAARSGLGKLVLESQNNMPDENNGINNAHRSYKEAVQFSASSIASLFASFWRSLWNGNKFCIFIVWVTPIKIANTPLDRSAALVLSVINWMNSSCTGICQIQLEIWPEPDFQKIGWIPDLQEPKSSITLINTRWQRSVSFINKWWVNGLQTCYMCPPNQRH